VFSVTVSDHMMVAHSLADEFFGPAQRVHGATYVVEATVHGATLDSHGVVVDIGLAAGQLRAVLAELEYRNLDDVPELAGVTTTTEVLAQLVADRLARRLADEGAADADRLTGLTVTLRESPVAWASYERSL
jgi:6-pyruvoyl-tetrahydropterin synthase